MSTGGRRTVVEAAYWLLVAPGVIWALVRLVGLERGGPAIQIVSFTPYAALASLVPLALVLLAKRWWVGGVAAVASVALFACVVPRMVGDPSESAGAELRVMATNMRVGGADATAIVDLVRRHRVDVLTIQ